MAAVEPPTRAAAWLDDTSPPDGPVGCACQPESPRTHFPGNVSVAASGSPSRRSACRAENLGSADVSVPAVFDAERVGVFKPC
jgi:hypothetical protein